MRAIVHPFLALLASSSRQDLAAQNRLLKAENKIVTNQQLDIILRRGSDWYNKRRGHSARDHLPPVRDDDSPPTIDLKMTRIDCHTELGGLLKSYRPAA